MNIEQEIRAQIEKNKGLKLAVGDINNHLSILEGLLRNERDDVQKQVNEAYQRGLDDAWEAARKIVLDRDEGGTSIVDLTEIFGSCTIQQVFRMYTVSHAVAKLKAYEEKRKADDEIKVGDEVIYIEHKFIVFATETEEHYASLFDVNGRHASASQSKCKKTGRHFDIPKILEEMRT